MSFLTKILNFATRLGQAITPVGTVLPFAGTTEPAKFLLCDGRAVSRITYAKLFALLGTKFGTGDGSTTFNLPDFRNRCFWGADGNIGSVLSSGLPNISGNMSVHYRNIGGTFAPFSYYNIGNKKASAGGNTITSHAVDFNASRSNNIYGKSYIVQPPALAVNFIIKY